MNGGLCAAFSTAATDRARGAVGATVARPRRHWPRPGIVKSSSASVRSSPPSSSSTSASSASVAQDRVVALDAGARSCRASIRRRAGARATRFDDRGTPAPLPATSWTRTIRHPCATPYATAAERRVAAVVDVEPEQLAEEALVRRREQQRVAVSRRARRSRAAAPRSSRASCRGRGRRRARSARGASPAASARAARSRRNAVTSAEQVVVVRLGVGHARARGGCGSRRPTRRACAATGEVVGVGEAADVVADDRAGLARLVEHAGPPRVARDRRRRSARAAPRSAGSTRSSSSASSTSGPGPAFTPPTSRRSAPSAASALGPAQRGRRGRTSRRGRRTSRACG